MMSDVISLTPEKAEAERINTLLKQSLGAECYEAMVKHWRPICEPSYVHQSYLSERRFEGAYSFEWQASRGSRHVRAPITDAKLAKIVDAIKRDYAALSDQRKKWDAEAEYQNRAMDACAPFGGIGDQTAEVRGWSYYPNRTDGYIKVLVDIPCEPEDTDRVIRAIQPALDKIRALRDRPTGS